MEIFLFVILDEAAPADHSLYVLTGALAFSTMLCVLLAVLLFKLHKRSSCQLTGKCPRPSVSYITCY